MAIDDRLEIAEGQITSLFGGLKEASGLRELVGLYARLKFPSGARTNEEVKLEKVRGRLLDRIMELLGPQ